MFQTTLDAENKEWDNKMGELQQNFANLENGLIDRQKNELEQLHEHLDRTLPIKSKPSSKLLNMRQIQQNLVKQKKYNEANEIKDKAAELEQEEEQKWADMRADKISTQEKQLMLKHSKERDALNKKTQSALAELERDRKRRVDQVIHNYHNTKKQTATAHNIELAQMSKFEKAGGSPSNRKSSDATGSSLMEENPSTKG